MYDWSTLHDKKWEDYFYPPEKEEETMRKEEAYDDAVKRMSHRAYQVGLLCGQLEGFAFKIEALSAVLHRQIETRENGTELRLLHSRLVIVDKFLQVAGEMQEKANEARND